LAPFSIGVDCEALARPRWEAARAYFGSAELARLPARGLGGERAAVLALWCAKEAVLKRAGIGLADLARCELVRHAGRSALVLRHAGRQQRVALARTETHVVALATEEPCELELHVLEPASAR